MYQLHFREELPDPVQREFEQLVAALKGFLLEEHNEDGTHHVTDLSLNLTPVGGAVMWPAASPPRGWLLCQGQEVSRVVYSGLFEVIGTTYGAGNGSTTFNLPNMTQRFPLGLASSGTGDDLGEAGGTINHTHLGPSHQHVIAAVGTHVHEVFAGGSHSHGQGAHNHAIAGVATAQAGIDVTVRASATNIDIFNDAGTSTVGDHDHSGQTGHEGAHNHGGLTSLDGTGATSTANPPYLTWNFIIFTGVEA